MRIIKAVIILVLLLSLQIFLLLFFSTSDSNTTLITVSKCLVNDRYGLECNNALNIVIIITFVIIDLFLSFIFSKSFIFEEIKDWQIQVKKELSQLQSY
jgi:hypothetical protein